jgi:hypothetical protein
MRALLALLPLLALLAACDSSHPAVSDGPTTADLTHVDLRVSDAKAPVDAFAGVLANVYVSNPIDNNKQTTKVPLQRLTDPALLSGEFVRVWNCVNEPAETININLGIQLTGKLCLRDQRAKRGTDGTYLHIAPPASDVDGGSSFAEIMMYHHVTTLHDYYKSTFGLTRIDKSLRSIVNLQGFADVLNQWVGFPNAAYMPKENADELKKLLGIDVLGGEEAIVFGFNNIIPGFGQVNFSFDASVIYHEYTHFAIGGDVLKEPGVDKYGLDPTSFALHEALSDYFPCSFLNNPKEGSYALGSQARDLTRVFKCPDHIIGESHYDGEVASGAFWAIRGLLGSKVADKAIWNAVLTFTASTTFEHAATAILDEIQKVAPTQVAAVQQIFVDRGLIACSRVKEHVDFDVFPGAGTSPGFEGKNPATLVFTDGIPAYSQYHLLLLSTTKEVTIEYNATSGGMYGIGGVKGDVAVALRRGPDPITYDYTSGKAVSSAQVTLKGADDPAGYKLVLSGSCISQGDVIFQMINLGTASGEVNKIKITQSPTVTSASPNFDVCK